LQNGVGVLGINTVADTVEYGAAGQVQITDTQLDDPAVMQFIGVQTVYGSTDMTLHLILCMHYSNRTLPFSVAFFIAET